MPVFVGVHKNIVTAKNAMTIRECTTIIIGPLVMILQTGHKVCLNYAPPVPISSEVFSLVLLLAFPIGCAPCMTKIALRKCMHRPKRNAHELSKYSNLSAHIYTQG